MKQINMIEPEVYEIYTKIDEMKRFLYITRNYSMKVGHHLKVICHLVNNIISSDDILQIFDQKLNLPSNIKMSFEKSTTNRDNMTLNSIYDKRDDKLMNVLISTFEKQNQNLWRQIEKGEQNADFIKNYIKRNSSQNNLYYNAQSQSQLSRCQTLQDNQLRFNEHNISFINHNNNKKTTGSNINNKFKRNQTDIFFKQTNMDFDEFDNDKMSVESLQQKVDQMSVQIQKLKAEKKNDEKGLHEIVSKLVEVKTENEDIIKQKDEYIKQLEKQVNIFKEQVLKLQQKNLKLKKRQKQFEKKVETLRSSKDNSEFVNLQKKYIKLKKTVDKENKKNINVLKNSESHYNLQVQKKSQELILLQDQIEQLSNKNIHLCQLLEQKEQENKKMRTESQQTNKFNQDILRCLFIQSQQIEQSSITLEKEEFSLTED